MYSPHTFGFLHCTPLTAAEIKINTENKRKYFKMNKTDSFGIMNTWQSL